MFSLWLPEQYPTEIRATAFAFCTSFGRFLGAGANFAIAGLIQWWGSLGSVIALTAIPFVIGLAVIPFALETKGGPCPSVAVSKFAQYRYRHRRRTSKPSDTSIN